MSSDSTHPRQRQQALPQGSPSLRSLTHSLCALMEGRAATVCYFVSHSRLWPRCPANRTTSLKMHVWFPATGASLLPADLLLMSPIIGGRVKYIFPLFWLIFHCKQCNFKWSLPAQSDRVLEIVTSVSYALSRSKNYLDWRYPSYLMN